MLTLNTRSLLDEAKGRVQSKITSRERYINDLFVLVDHGISIGLVT